MFKDLVMERMEACWSVKGPECLQYRERNLHVDETGKQVQARLEKAIRSILRTVVFILPNNRKVLDHFKHHHICILKRLLWLHCGQHTGKAHE
jgi:hypothetical protein